MSNIVSVVACMLTASAVAASEWGFGAGIVVFSLCGFVINASIVTVSCIKENQNE